MVILMKVYELNDKVFQRLLEGGCDSPSFDACCLLEDVGGLGRGNVQRFAEREVSDEVSKRVLEAAERRAAGEPLQYLLGTWDFLNLTLAVGEGVLIPRPETELLCELVAQKLRNVPSPHVLDLCAGSGCVGLGIASLYPAVSVTALEKSEQAFSFLTQNIKRYPSLSVIAEKADVLCDAPRYTQTVDAIVSNPPYIPTLHLPSLQREVQKEPAMALDGGADGLDFYRVIASQWCTKLRSGGFVAVEIGIGQAEAVSALFAEAGLINVQVFSDFAGIERIIYAETA